MVTKMLKYEYKTVPMPRFINEFDDSLNKLAQDMWEPVTIFTHPKPQEFYQVQVGKEHLVFAIFKRQIS
jgi:hypothetical protein